MVIAQLPFNTHAHTIPCPDRLLLCLGKARYNRFSQVLLTAFRGSFACVCVWPGGTTLSPDEDTRPHPSGAFAQRQDSPHAHQPAVTSERQRQAFSAKITPAKHRLLPTFHARNDKPPIYSPLFWGRKSPSTRMRFQERPVPAILANTMLGDVSPLKTSADHLVLLAWDRRAGARRNEPIVKGPLRTACGPAHHW